MARQPFFSGDYGSSLAQIDTRPIMQGAAAQAAAYQGIGQNIGGAIEKYGLMKQKRNKLSAQIEGRMQGPRGAALIQSLTSSGNEEFDKGNQTLIDKVLSGDAKMAELERLSGITSTLVDEENAVAKQKAAQLDGLYRQSQVTNSLLDAQGKELENKFKTANEKNRLIQENMKTLALERADTMGELELKLRKEKDPLVIKELNRKIKAGELENEGLERSNLFDKETYSARRDTILHREQEAEAGKFAAVAMLDSGDPDAADWKEADAQIKAAKLKNVDLVFGRNAKGKGLVITSIKGDIESLGQRLPGFPDHLLYGGSFYDLSGPKPVKVGVEDVMTIPKMNIAAVNALMDEVTTDYLRHKQLGELNDDGYYVMDLGDGDESQVLQSVAMDQKVLQILRLQEGIADPLDIR
jgi:hypothetical protein